MAYSKEKKNQEKMFLSIDAGSTTVKVVLAVLGEEEKFEVIYRDYQRHGSRPLQRLHQMLQNLEQEFNLQEKKTRLYVTGSAGTTIAKILQARFVQEVTAVTHAVEKLYPQVQSVIELGGQDAKMIFFKEPDKNGIRRKVATMNDKCAGGTGAVIDKIANKLNLGSDALAELRYRGSAIHFVAGKCGVFAETDINGLQKQGIPPTELMASLYQAIVLQNLSVLTRGNTILPSVMLLGGPNSFLPGMQEAWEHNLNNYWKERDIEFDGYSVIVPQDSLYFAALGALFYGFELENDKQEFPDYSGFAPLQEFLQSTNKREHSSGKPLAITAQERYRLEEQHSAMPIVAGKTIEVFAGVDGGSTSCKGVFLNSDGDLVARSYRLSQGNPLEDAIFILQDLHNKVEQAGGKVELKSLGVTGYSKEVLQRTFSADIAVVETVAHMRAAKKYYPNVDVIVDVGGQDIKLIYMKDGHVQDFRLNTQCSAGNGYFLQSAANSFGFQVEDYADAAFQAQEYPVFSCGCAVFLQSDIVDFQRQGWKPEEIMAGLADVLPRNIWQHVAEENNLQKLGSTFVLQGGTQKNLAAVKAQMDYIEKKFSRSDVKPKVFVHRFSAEAGAAGAAIEGLEKYLFNVKSAVKPKEELRSSFIGFDKLDKIKFTTKRNESTRCYFCRNHCLRTFIDVDSAEESRRIIIAPCEKGESEDKEQMRLTQKQQKGNKHKNPDLVQYASHIVWASQEAISSRYRKKFNVPDYFADTRIGVPRVLNFYNLMPFFTGFFETLGIKPGNLVFSSYTSAEMYREGASRGSVDTCYPSKVALAHLHELLFHKENLNGIFFPLIDSFASPLQDQVGERACPTAVGTSTMVYSSFTREEDLFAKHNVNFYAPYLNLENRDSAARQLYSYFKEFFPALKKRDVRVAVSAGMAALSHYQKQMQQKGKEVLRLMKEEKRMGVVVLGRPYHNDPGINHEITAGIQKSGFPVLPISALPYDDDSLQEVFGQGRKEAMDIKSVWKNPFSVNSSMKIWAARYTALSPYLAGVELSNFKCGHDAPIYSTIEKILESHKTPHFIFGDIDENNPGGAIAIRLETMSYFLQEKIQELREKLSLHENDFQGNDLEENNLHGNEEATGEKINAPILAKSFN